MIDKGDARAVFDEAVAWVDAGGSPAPDWITRIEDLSRACGTANLLTHVAFIGTAILAKSTEPSVDAASLSVKEQPRGYSARSLAKNVLVPAAAEHGVHLGRTGREPLNNQPYFRLANEGRVTLDALVQAMKADGDDKRENVALAVCGIIERLEAHPGEALDALRAFIAVRRRYVQTFDPLAGSIAAARLLDAVERVATIEGSGGRIAQALAAGLLDAAFGERNVTMAERVNDPDRHLPADIAIREDGQPRAPHQRAVEVRDKPVSQDDVLGLARKMAERGVPHALVLAVARGQAPLAAAGDGPTVAVCTSWRDFFAHLHFWASIDPQVATERVHARLIEIEAPARAIALWERAAHEPDVG